MLGWFKKRKLAVLNRIEISAAAIGENWEEMREQAGEQEIWPVVKANAYGHGLEIMTEILAQKSPRYLVADSYYEALKIWRVNPKQRVLLIGSMHPDNLTELNYAKLALMVQDGETVEKLGSLGQTVKVHLKVDTGMSRQGVGMKDLGKLIEELKRHKNIEVEGLMSHLADSDNEDETNTRQQIKRFEAAKQEVWEKGLTPKFWHLAATTGAGKVPRELTNAVRVGLGLYLGRRPALRWVSTLTKVGTINKGDQVSYNGAFTAPKKMVIGVVPVGYYEGLQRRLSNKGKLRMGKKEVPILGRVCMNLTVVGLEGVSAAAGEEVEVISNERGAINSVENMAKLCETIPYEILVGLDESIRRVRV